MKPDKEKEPCGNTALAGKKYVDCLQCHCKVPDSNFCIKCGAKLHKYCKCVILHKRYDCGHSKCWMTASEKHTPKIMATR